MESHQQIHNGQSAFKNDDATGYGHQSADGYTTEAVSDPNAATETQDYDTAALAGANLGEDGYYYYDQSQYQNNFYYQDEDGNYYMYPDQPAETAAAGTDGGGVVPTPQNIVRSYEYDDWEPPSNGWFVDIVVDTFFSKAFKVYLTVLLYCAGVLIGSLGLNFTFAILFRLYSPPVTSSGSNPDIQALCFLSLFFYMSFVVCSAFCALMDMVKNLWYQQKEDITFWGMSHRYFSKQKPPYLIFLCIIILTVFMPILWAVIDAGVNKQSLVFVAQRYANVAVLVAVFLVVICYVWFYWRALVYKHSAVDKYKQRDEFRLREKAFKFSPEKMSKTHWYHASTILEEFGVDGKTLRYNCVVFTIGCVPIFAMYAGQTLSTYTGDPSVTWGAISSIALMCLYTVGWLSLLNRKNQWSVYASFFLNVLLLVLGLVGGGIGGRPAMVGIVIVLFAACQGMLARKRKHALTRSELCAALKIPFTAESGPKKERKHIDTYLFCCRNVILDYLKCFDVKTIFGYRHPDVVKAERRYAIDRIALRTDQKALLVWWLIVMFAIAFVIALGNAVSYKFTDTIARASSEPVPGDDPATETCRISFNAHGKAQLNMLDLAFLSALSYTYGENGSRDFATWFSHVPTLVRQFPVHLPPTLNYATNGIQVRFSDYVDTSNGFHFITLNSNSRGMSIFRNMDDWGESMTLQAAAAVSPLIGIWPEQYRSAFVQNGAFLKEWFPPSTALDQVSLYIENLIASDLRNKTLLIGDQFNGGYAKILSSKYNISFVAFNAPGTRSKIPFLSNGVQLTSARSLWSYIDSVEDTASTYLFSCANDLSSNKCGRITTAIGYLLTTCGDPYGRSMLDA